MPLLLRERPDAVERVVSLSASFARISSRSQNSRPRSCTHSKYETVTPPAFVRMSGRIDDPALGEDLVRLDRRRPVRALGDELRTPSGRVLGRDLLLERGEDEDVARQLEQLGVRDVLDVRVVGERAVLPDPGGDAADVEPPRE